MTQNPWFKALKSNPDAEATFFCFPHAGGGSLFFKNWAKYPAEYFEIFCAQLPGRENRRKEPFITNMDSLLSELADAVKPYLDRPFYFFGHSMGAVVCFELARKLRGKGLPLPRRLFVSGRQAPHIPDRDCLYKLPDAEFIEKLREYNGIPDAVLNFPGMMKFFLPALRADFQVRDTYRHTVEEPLDCPISVFNGREDNMTEQKGLWEWRSHTSGDFDLTIFPGGHFYLNDQAEAVLKNIEAKLF